MLEVSYVLLCHGPLLQVAVRGLFFTECHLVRDSRVRAQWNNPLPHSPTQNDHLAIQLVAKERWGLAELCLISFQWGAASSSPSVREVLVSIVCSRHIQTYMHIPGV